MSSSRSPSRRGPMGNMFGPPPEKPKDFRQSLRRLLGEIRPEKLNVTFVFLMVSASVIIGAFGPKILGQATNEVFYGYLGKNMPQGTSKEQTIEQLRTQGQGRVATLLSDAHVIPGQGINFDVVARFLWLAVILYVISSFLMWAQGYVMAGVTQRTIYSLRRQCEEKINRLPLSYFDKQSRGDLLSRVTNDIENIANAFQMGFAQILNSALTIISILAMMLWISPLLAVISVVAVPLSMYTTVMIAKRSRGEFVAQWDWTGKLNGHVEEMHTGHALIKVYGQRERAIDTFTGLNQSLYESSFKAQFISGVIQPATALISNLIYVGISVLGGYRVATGTMSLGDVQAFVQYARQFSTPLSQIAGLINNIQSGVASSERVFELLDVEEEASDAHATATLDRARGAVTFEHVRFRYSEDRPLIEDFSLQVEPGQTVAIVGPTGAGKTTMVNLLLRFYEVSSGRITVDDIDIRDLTRDNLRKQFGMVLQDTWLFTGSVAENIGYGTMEPSRARIAQAAEAAHVDHLIRSLPDGYDTLLTDENAYLSNGERQLVTIARAFVADPAILILDEATSSVDTRTEVLVQKAMANLRKGRTSFVIAHRLSTIRDADVILVMNEGNVVEHGSHSELMAAHGFYWDLYTSQFDHAGVTEEETAT